MSALDKRKKKKYTIKNYQYPKGMDDVEQNFVLYLLL